MVKNLEADVYCNIMNFDVLCVGTQTSKYYKLANDRATLRA